MNCNVCGSENLIKGTIYDTEGGGTGSFIPDETPAYKKMFAKVFAMGGRKVQSYGCIHCGNLQFFIEFSDEDRERHLEFHGQAPSITEDLETIE